MDRTSPSVSVTAHAVAGVRAGTRKTEVACESESGCECRCECERACRYESDGDGDSNFHGDGDGDGNGDREYAVVMEVSLCGDRQIGRLGGCGLRLVAQMSRGLPPRNAARPEPHQELTRTTWHNSLLYASSECYNASRE